MSSIPVVTRNLLIINILVWLAQFLLGRVIEIDKYLALHFFESDLFMPHQIITYMFLHDPSSPAHLFFNMFAVYMFGRTLEMVWGPKRFLVYYLLTGIGAAVAQELVYAIEYREIVFNSAIINVNIGEQIINKQDFYNILPPTLGASGAVFGILVAFGMLFPNVELMMLFFPVPIKAKWFVIGYGVIELFLGIANSAGDNVAHFAHLGGLITGFFIILYWRKKGKANGHNFREY
ncbi:MAG TPA: rhomboid family intramembrane serine protease [Dysgonomonas sp.]|uniref:rhomboid family intramembrane serine protease n=1 Tax=Dysgonomonas TaxID=156973 RepID=UPI00208E37C6|nr:MULTISPECIES: rhomboid family intramembrane serine protease [Dysgonomonas]HML66375.1 rhomboid family intramembrane serine protease [Dysgonomonas sp.]